MKLSAFALDYDGTISANGGISHAVSAAIAEVRRRGIRVVLVTGRLLADLQRLVTLDLFDAVVAENGAVLHFPESGRHARLGHPPAQSVLDELTRRGVPFTMGECLIAADAGVAVPILEVIREQEQPLVLLFNRGSLMVLPQAIAKSTGLRGALRALRVSLHNTLAIGDAENDHDLLDACEVGVAVGWGSAALRAIADEVIEGSGPAAVAAYLRRVSAHTRLSPAQMGRRRLLLGTQHDGQPFSLAIRGRTVLIAGEPGTGKSWLAGLMCEQLILQGYSLVILDAEGDYRALETLPGVTALGGDDPPPHGRELRRALRPSGVSLIIDLSKMSYHQKHEYLRTVLPVLAAERRRTGLPHKIVVDEAHQFLYGAEAATLLDPELAGYICVTYRVSSLDASVAEHDAVIIVTRETNAAELDILSRRCGRPLTSEMLGGLGIDEAAILPGPAEAQGEVHRFQIGPRLTSHVRHRQKYFDMPVSEGQAFVFTSDGSVNARALTLKQLVRLLRDASTPGLKHHLERHDFSRWVRDVFRDGPLAAHLAATEARVRYDDPGEVADALAQAIRARYDIEGAG